MTRLNENQSQDWLKKALNSPNYKFCAVCINNICYKFGKLTKKELTVFLDTWC